MHANLGNRTARMVVNNIAVQDDHDFGAALAHGPSVPAHVSFDMRWFNPTTSATYHNADIQFAGDFTQTTATIAWSAKRSGFRYKSDAASTSTTVYAEVGHERNGLFFT